MAELPSEVKDEPIAASFFHMKDESSEQQSIEISLNEDEKLDLADSQSALD